MCFKTIRSLSFQHLYKSRAKNKTPHFLIRGWLNWTSGKRHRKRIQFISTGCLSVELNKHLTLLERSWCLQYYILTFYLFSLKKMHTCTYFYYSVYHPVLTPFQSAFYIVWLFVLLNMKWVMETRSQFSCWTQSKEYSWFSPRERKWNVIENLRQDLETSVSDFLHSIWLNIRFLEKNAFILC